jgi:hypothetical protein
MVPLPVSVAPTMASVIRKQYVNDNARHPMNVNFSLNGERNGACSGRGTQSVRQNVSPVRKTSIA